MEIGSRQIRIAATAAIMLLFLGGCGGGDDNGGDNNYYTERYGTFTPMAQQSGDGDSTVLLPEGATSGIVTATHSGTGSFAIQPFDANNQPTEPKSVSASGAYNGVARYGLDNRGDTVKLAITATGPWTLVVAPVADAPSLTLPASGNGDAVYLYDGGAEDWTFSHTGTENNFGNFIVGQNTEQDYYSAINTFGEYQGIVPMQPGPSVISITADGSWTISKP